MTTTRSTVVITANILKYNIKIAVSNGLPITLSDAEVRGLTARISPTGRVTWVASKAFGKGKGSTQRVVVGHYPGMDLTQARIEAGQTIARLAKGEAVASQVKAATLGGIRDRMMDEKNPPSAEEMHRYRQQIDESMASLRVEEHVMKDIAPVATAVASLAVPDLS